MFNGRKLSVRNNMLIAFPLCLGISVLAIILISLGFALVANMLTDPTGMLGLFSLFSLILGGVIGGFASAKIKREGAVFFSALVALALILIMLIVCVIIEGKISGSALMNYICFFSISVASAFLGSREKRHHRKR